ncbi:hypothetical protein ACFQE1_02780 [Halobium palmae]|uniref:Uncharacterized protein n=1 Tax=Halobium palmae TaxID=1776492 RepID=A0ABD5RVE6_9EURY
MGTYTRADIRSAIQAAAQAVTDAGAAHLASTFYRDWRRERLADTDTDTARLPSVSTICNSDTARYDTWRAACADAGITPGLYRRSGDGAGSVARYDRDAFRTALREAAAAMGEPLTERAYQDWRAEQSRQTPSPTLFTPRKSSPYESWSAACQDAGVETHGAQPQSYSTADIRAAILAATATRDDLLRICDYKTWREAQLEAGATAIPSVSAICYGESAAFESWKAARLDALLSEHFDDEAE